MKKLIRYILAELFLFILAVLAVFSILWFIFYLLSGTDEDAIEHSRQAGLGFSQVCNELNGQPFTFDSIKKLNGFVDLNGRVQATQKDVDEYLEKHSNANAYFHIYHQSWFQGNGIEHTWYCDIKVNETNTIKATAIFHTGD